MVYQSDCKVTKKSEDFAIIPAKKNKRTENVLRKDKRF
jgi:hypothetical protein